MDQFEYKPLLQNEIRLLKADSNQNLDFVLEHVNINTKHNYAALSYTWGEPVFPHMMHVDKCVFNITENLYDALQQVVSHWAHKRLRLSGKYIWIDAICINQSNDEEKSQQLRLMRRIYEEAESVLVWLGRVENEDRHKLAMRMIADLYSRYIRALKKNRPYRPWWWPNKPVIMKDDINTLQLSTPASDKTVYDIEGSATHSAWIGIRSIVEVSWWSRTWVFQEATVPENSNFLFIRGGPVIPRGRKVTFMYGPSLISWIEFMITTNVAVNLRSATGFGTEILGTLINNIPALDQLRQSRISHQRRPFLELLQVFRHTLCKDPRDKVYAPLCLASNDVVKKIIPDYRRSPLTVYIDVINNFAIQDHGHELDFLGYTMTYLNPLRESSDGISLSHWPSWLPNWDQPLLIYPFAKVIHIDTIKGRSIRPWDVRSVSAQRSAMYRRSYNASKGSKLRASISGTQLNIEGFQCDVIQDIIRRPTGPIVSSQKHDKAKAWARRAKGQYVTGESFGSAISRTECADIKYRLNGHAYDREGSVDLEFLEKARDRLSNTEYEAQTTMKIALNTAMLLRNLCLTQKGYLGLVPISANVGDVLCMFLGGQVMYCLRRNSNVEHEHEYIGECYLHGLMDGEAITWVEERSVTVEQFALV